MARCKCGFELAVIQCPNGCGGTRKPQKQVARARTLPPVREALFEPRRADFTDRELASALAMSPSLKAAQAKLHSTWLTVRDRARGKPALWAAYLACRERGRGIRVRPSTRRAG